MSRTFKDRRDHPAEVARVARQARRDKAHMSGVLRFSMRRYVDANARGNVDRSQRWFAAVDRSSRILSALD
jgi:hypothetical protein